MRYIISRILAMFKFKKTMRLPTPIAGEKVMDRYTVSWSKPQGPTEFVGIGDPLDTKRAPYGWAFIEYDDDQAECFLWMIFVQPRHRRKGYGRDLLRILQERFKKVTTGYEPKFMATEGVKLCMACGFQPKPGLHKRSPSLLVWERHT